MPEKSLRASSLVQRCGWVSEVVTLEGEGESMPYSIPHEREVYRYAEGRKTLHKRFVSDYRLRPCCDRYGIHIFTTLREAEDYVKPLVEWGIYRWKTGYRWGCNCEEGVVG